MRHIKNLLKALFIFSFIFPLLSVTTKAAAFYVDGTCNLNGNGQSQICATASGGSGPFNSLSSVKNIIKGSQPDNQLLFKAGQTFASYAVNAYGTAGHPFTIGAYGSGAKPVFDGGGTGPYPNEGAVSIVNISNVTVDGIATTHAPFGIWMYRNTTSAPTTGIIIKNSSAYNTSQYAIDYYTEPGLDHTDLSTSEIYGNETWGSATGVYVHRVRNIKIHNNKIHDNVNNGQENYGIAVECGSGLQIYDNLIYNNFLNGIGVYGDSTQDLSVGGFHSDNNKVYRNIIYGTKPVAWARDITWQSPAGDYVGSNNSIYDNILYSANSSISHFQDDSRVTGGNVFYNNVMVGGHYGMETHGASWTAANNIFYNTTAFYSTSNLTLSNNILPGTDPKFVNPSADWTGFRLQAGSPAIDKGANLGTAYAGTAYDPDNLTWPGGSSDQNSNGSAWEIGAYVYKNGINPSPTPGVKPGDVNGDGSVNILDIGIVIDNYGLLPIPNPAADVNHDGVVNILDIGIIIDNYGK